MSGSDMAASVAALRDENDSLDALVRAHAGDAFFHASPFYGWRPYDTIAHLIHVDRLARLTLTDAAGFATAMQDMAAGIRPENGAASDERTRYARFSAYQKRLLGPLGADTLLDLWRAGVDALCAALLTRRADEKTNWFGPPMRASSLAAARQMEVWGYGQDVFDLFRVRRVEQERLRIVADFAIRTRRFAFANRGLTPPDPAPYVRLAGPSGRSGNGTTRPAPERVEGDAAEFCLVATRRRHLADTGLRATGDGAQTWLEIAQCIAGPPATGPAPGERTW